MSIKYSSGRGIRVVHVVERLSVLHGGSTTAAFAIATATAPEVLSQLIGPAESGIERAARVVPLASGRRMFPLRVIGWLYARRASIDIVEIHNVFGPSSLFSLLYCVLIGQPFVLNPHNSLDEMDLQKKRRLKQVIGYGFLSWVLTCGGHVRCATRREYQRLERFGGSWISSWALLPIPVKTHSVTRGEVRIAELKGGAELKLLFMSRIDRKKRLDVLLRAIDKARKELAPFKLIIAGAGDQAYECELRKKINELGLDDTVEWRGFVKGDAKTALLCEADAFILPSAYENFGIVVLEALACGLKPVVSNMVFIADHLDSTQCIVVNDDKLYETRLKAMRSNVSTYWSDMQAARSSCELLEGSQGAQRIKAGYAGMLKSAGIGAAIV